MCPILQIKQTFCDFTAVLCKFYSSTELVFIPFEARFWGGFEAS